MYFKEKKAGRGPREFKVGRRTFITFEAAAKWRAEREAARAQKPLRGEHQRGAVMTAGPTPDQPLKKVVKGDPTMPAPGQATHCGQTVNVRIGSPYNQSKPRSMPDEPK